MLKQEKLILSYYLKYPKLTIKAIAEDLDVERNTVSTILNEYIRDLILPKELFFCLSLVCGEEDGYLFDDFAERKVEIIQNNIINKSDFTQYELDWLKNNYNLKSHLD